MGALAVRLLCLKSLTWGEEGAISEATTAEWQTVWRRMMQSARGSSVRARSRSESTETHAAVPTRMSVGERAAYSNRHGISRRC